MQLGEAGRGPGGAHPAHPWIPGALAPRTWENTLLLSQAPQFVVTLLLTQEVSSLGVLSLQGAGHPAQACGHARGTQEPIRKPHTPAGDATAERC